MIVNIALGYLAIGALIWASLIAHAASRHGARVILWTLLLCLLAWPRTLWHGWWVYSGKGEQA